MFTASSLLKARSSLISLISISTRTRSLLENNCLREEYNYNCVQSLKSSKGSFSGNRSDVF